MRNLITISYHRLDWEMQWDWIYARWTCCDPVALSVIG